MAYLTADQVLFVQYRFISETDREDGIRDIGLLESAVARPESTMEKFTLQVAKCELDTGGMAEWFKDHCNI